MRQTILPQPTQRIDTDGRFRIDQTFTVDLTGYVDDRLEAATTRFITRLSKLTGMVLLDNGPSRSDHSEFHIPHSTLHIASAGPADPVQSVDADESYRLTIDTPAPIP